jgi:signal transduction histidine kinase
VASVILLERRLHSLRSSVAFRLSLFYAGILAIAYFVDCLVDLTRYGVHGLAPHIFDELLEIGLGVFIASFMGWLVASRALSGVSELARTAKAISNGVFDSRVPVKGNKDQLDELAATFNSMVERIQMLIKGMKEVTDSIAHDLRSPVTRMRGLAEVTLTTERLNAECEAMAGSVVEECDRLLGMINGILEISAAESGIVPLHLHKVDVSEIARDACELFQPAAEDKGITVTVEAPGPACVDGDLQKLQRVLANLLDNAVKYTESGGQIGISVTKDDGRVIIVMKDTGIGIAESDLSHIFERFYRADKSRSKPGSGLGLTLAKAFVSAHDGKITVTSRLGEGSTFTVNLPITRLKG